MLKFAAQGIAPRIVAGLAGTTQGSCQHVNLGVGAALQKFISQGHCYNRKVIVTNHYEFDQKIINSDNPVVVNFHAEWCDPCKLLTPKMSELLDNSEEIDLATIDVDKNSELVATFEVNAVPAVLAFRNGVIVDKFVGLVDANSIENLINKLKRKKKQTDEDVVSAKDK